MSYSDGMEGTAPIFYIGYHETKRDLDVSSELIQHAQDLGVGRHVTCSLSLELMLGSMICSRAQSRTTTFIPAF